MTTTTQLPAGIRSALTAAIIGTLREVNDYVQTYRLECLTDQDLVDLGEALVTVNEKVLNR